jgi:hypothetical protein
MGGGGEVVHGTGSGVVGEEQHGTGSGAVHAFTVRGREADSPQWEKTTKLLSQLRTFSPSLLLKE